MAPFHYRLQDTRLAHNEFLSYKFGFLLEKTHEPITVAVKMRYHLLAEKRW